MDATSGVWRGWVLLGIFASAVLMQVTFDALLPASLAENASTDFTDFYLPVAENLSAGEGLTIRGAPATFWPPGYPVLLAVTFEFADMVGADHGAAVDALRYLTIGAAAVVLYLLFERLFPRRTSLLALALWMVLPLNLYLGKQPNSELPFRVLLYSALLSLVIGVQRRRWGWMAAAGGLLGMATLVRPAALLLGTALAVVLVVRGLRRDSTLVPLGAALVVANLALLLPWQIWLSAHTEQFALVSTNGTAAVVDGLTIGTDPDEESVPGFTASSLRVMRAATVARPELDSYSGLVTFMGDQVRREPAGVAQLLVIKGTRAWYATDSGTGGMMPLVLQLPVLLLVSAGIWAEHRAGRLGRLKFAVTVGVALYFWTITVTVGPLARYMAPSEGLLLPFAAIAIEAVLMRSRHASHPTPSVAT